MATFTSWLALKTQLLNDLASGSWKTSSYKIGAREMSYRSFGDFKAMLDFVDEHIAEEAGTVYGRTHAKPMGRF